MRVSVVITNFGYGDLIQNAINSVLNQTYPVSLYVVDNGEVDDSWAIIQKSYDGPIFHVEQPLGVANAKNLGLRVLDDNYDIVGFLDADDELVPTAIERVVKTFDKRIGVVYGDCVEHNCVGNYSHRIFNSPFVLESLARGTIVNHSIFLAHRAVAKVGLFDDGLAVNEVYDLVWRVGEAMPIVHLPEVLTENNFTTRSLRHVISPDQWLLTQKIIFQKAKNRAEHNNTSSRNGGKTESRP